MNEEHALLLTMPSLGRYSCETCNYIANNRRMLARHVAVVHSNKVYKCPLCSFITRYAANWYRHKRDIHGLTKFTTCEVCGFFANSTQELAVHKESNHPEQLPLQQYQENHTQEKQTLEADSSCNNYIYACESIEPNFKFSSVNKDEESENPDKSSINVSDDSKQNNSFSSSLSASDDSVLFSLPLNAGVLENDANASLSESKVINDTQVSETMSSNNAELLSNTQLSPLKVRRSYCCDSCGLLTGNPREFLYHQRDVHNIKINVHECKYCIYASKHIQKLQRHCNLIHRAQMLQEQKLLKQNKRTRSKSNESEHLIPTVPSSLNNQMMYFRSPADNVVCKSPVKKKNNTKLLHCTACSYHTRNKFLLLHHEKTVHLKKKFYRCLQCGYVTNEKARYTKHIKYHSLPKMQCEFCHFKSAYKWNMERHMKNHLTDLGEYSCTFCNFITHSKHSLKLHVANHHDLTLNDYNNISEEGLEDDCLIDDIVDFDANVNDSEWEKNFHTDDNSFTPGYNVNDNNVQVSSNNKDYLWKQGKIIKKNLKCQYCDFKAAWPFEIRKHEENHRSTKKHPCPLCGMRFEHIAWLTKHLYRIHKENSQAKAIAAAFERLKPNRRKTAKDSGNNSVLPIFDNVIKQVVSVSEKPTLTKQSMLSTLLRKPTVPGDDKSGMFSRQQKPKLFNKSPFGQKQECDEFETQALYSVPINKAKSSKGISSCKKCGYKTKWVSEMEKHMRVHSDEKPFRCTRCNYHSKWKGDLSRHMMKYHGIKLPCSGKKFTVPKLRLKKAVPSKFESGNSWQAVNQELTIPSNIILPSTSEGKIQESPLDLTITKTFPYPLQNIIDMTSEQTNEIIDLTKENNMRNQIDYRNPLNSMNSDLLEIQPEIDIYKISDEQSVPSPVSAKRKYFCPFCSFNTSTASRFHVHIIQHYNKRPFMCSFCGYRSNWEWDITKHIRLRGCKDKAHSSACVLLTDETGRRNYDKYDKYLKDVDDGGEINAVTETDVESSIPYSYMNKNDCEDDYNQKCAVNDSAAVTDLDEAPVNIVVTPDININLDQEVVDKQDVYSHSAELNNVEENSHAQNNFKFYLCKHCNYKHVSRKVVISHLAIHAGLRPFRCRVCGLTSNWRHVVVRHVKVAHNGYMSDVEDRITYTQEGYVIRLTSIKAETRSVETVPVNKSSHYSCKLCPYKCDKEVYIKFHMKQHKPREGAIYQCMFCPYYVKFKKTLVRHMKLHDAPAIDTQNSMNECNITVSSNENYDKDFSFNGNCDPYDFNNDNQATQADDSIPIAYDQLQLGKFDILDSLSKNKRHICENCPYKTDNKTQYLYHKQFHRPNAAAPFKCSVCSYWATMQHLLTQHMKVHRDNEPNSLKEETSNFSEDAMSKPKLRRSKFEDVDHISCVFVKRGDQVTKMFKCRFCPMMNKKKANVRGHQKMHKTTTNDKRPSCTICNYRCLNQGGLTNHMKIHQTNEEIQVKEFGACSEKSSSDANSPLKRKVFSYFCMKCPAVFKSSSDLYIHKNFHGSTLPFPCPHCDYRARHKPHLHKHLQVHTASYISKRDASYGPQVNEDDDNLPVDKSYNSEISNSTTPLNTKKVDQMLLLEASEMKTFLRKGKEITRRMHKCTFCPAAFFKTATLAYHISLHGSNGEFGCSQCNYSTTRSANLSVHAQVHSKISSPSKRLQRTLCCPKCPAVFSKNDRYEKHLALHGRNYRFVCDQCDYSVRFAANLFKHKKTVHKNSQKNEGSKTANATVDNDKVSNAFPAVTVATVPQSAKHQTDISKQAESPEEKKMFICDRCPYFQSRKDAVQSHQRRHWQKEGYKCPYCDYSSMGSSFLRDHVKTHIQPTHLFPPQAFMKYNKFEIWCKETDKKELLFEDKGKEYEPKERFFPVPVENSDDPTNAPSKCKLNISKTNSKSSKKNRSLEPLKEAFNDTDSKDSESGFSSEKSVSEVQPNYLPKVVLTDIFCEKKNIKMSRFGNTSSKRNSKSTKSSINYSSELSNKETDSQKTLKKSFSVDSSKCNTQSKITSESACGSPAPCKSSLVVKIKMESKSESSNEKSMYVIARNDDKELENPTAVETNMAAFNQNSSNISVENNHELLEVKKDLVNMIDCHTSEIAEDEINKNAVQDDQTNCVLNTEVPNKSTQLPEKLCVSNFTPLTDDDVPIQPKDFNADADFSKEFSTDFLKELNSLVIGVTSETLQKNDFRPEIDVHI